MFRLYKMAELPPSVSLRIMILTSDLMALSPPIGLSLSSLPPPPLSSSLPPSLPPFFLLLLPFFSFHV